MCRMGDVLAGNHAVWEFDSDSVLIRFARGIRTPRSPRLLHALGARRIPFEALSGVSVNATGSGGKRDAVVLHAVPRAGADPLMEAAAGQLRAVCDPYRLVLPGDRAAQAAEFADAVRARLGPDAADPAERFLVEVPQPPLQLKAYDARLGFDGSAVTFHWSRTGATSTKWKAGDQRYPLSALTGVEWSSPEAPGGHLRLLRRDATGDPRPDHDLAAAVFGVGYGAVHESLPFAAAVLAALRGRTPVAAVPAARTDERLHHLSELYSAGLLTDAEYAALRDRFAADA
ncbi:MULTISPECIES: DUF4429 domain-containing protein [unclassified Streptomyces]|uniref:DUF4429 domain-containing protein n=1 Tax=unclassified Streptomyces TaxID=2593676 RepID=UPI0022578C1A|nr:MULTISPECIES: DUF4429 domain-containing protein [unclassified Streptomyces]MCX5147902.1 DUF4429 domain-containing protein [Streptomyces sp. NBC_00320]WSN51015.1 DUF4429 domain-containing protein [Streptomyces sp. NBC_01296]WSW59533.1 DUF4429 domain-containing protein [Streptomyces sp. NBC_00998]